jgi:hypothetical protein
MGIYRVARRRSGGFMRQTTMGIERSEVVDGDLGHLWALLSSPAAWSLWPAAQFMFAVPGAPTFRFLIGPTGGRTGSMLFEVSEEVPGAMLRLRTLPARRQEFTLSVAPGRRGTAKASVRVKEVAPRQRKIDYETKRSRLIEGWLSVVRAVIEGRAPWPSAHMAARLRQACMARPRISDAQCTSASALISADPATVWNAVHSPETARVIGPSPAIYSGYVPGTPQEEAGEMQYFVHRWSDGRFAGHIEVVTEIARHRSALLHSLGPLQTEERYLLTPEAERGATRLDVTLRWQRSELTDTAEAARAAQAQLSDYDSLIKSAGRHA